MKQIVCIWLPQWPLQHLGRQQPELNGRPVLLHSPLTERTPRIVACSLLAWRRGVRPEMPLVEARALLAQSPYTAASSSKSQPCWVLQDPAADRAALRQLAVDCDRYTPLHGLETDLPEGASPESLLLDVTGAVGLFGGAEQLVQRIQDDFQAAGWRTRVALAPTIGAAWAGAHGISRPNQPVVITAADWEETLDRLPVQLLRLPPAIVATLSELGIHGVGQLRRLPRNQLPARFGPLLLQRLDQAFGRVPELLVVERGAEPLVATWCSPEPLGDREVLREICGRLLEQLLAPLTARRRGARRVLCQFHGGGRPSELVVGLAAPSRSASQVQELLALQLERLPWQDDFTCIRLEAVDITSWEECPRDLFGERTAADQARGIRDLLERLSSRLGAAAVVRAAAVPDPQPEFAVAYSPWLETASPTPPLSRSDSGMTNPALALRRPLRLLATPERLVVEPPPDPPPRQFRWGGAEHRVRRTWGPERIQTGWWRGAAVRRDYYRVEVTSGERYWLFHTTDGWFLHGVFD